MSQLLLNGQPIPSGYTITIYRYEPFYYLFTPLTGVLKLTSKSTLLNSLVSSSDPGNPIGEAEIYFQSPGYDPNVPLTELGGYVGALSTAEQIVIGWGDSISPTTGELVIQQTYTINVTISAGRFILPPLTTPSYTLYKNEPISFTFGENIRFQAPGNLTVSTPFVVPSLPPGISLVPIAYTEEQYTPGSSPTLYWDLTGTPIAVTPATSYTIYARGSVNPSFVISKTVTITIADERIFPIVSPSSNVALTVNSPIVTTTLTAVYPSTFPGNLVYAWSFLPDGLRFVDSLSNTVTSPFAPLDSNSTLSLVGTPTVDAAQYFRTLGVSNVTTNVLAVRQTSPNITVTQPFSLTFGETVLFDSIVVPTLYAGVTLDPSAIVFRANTYFPFSAGVSSITAASLPTGLSLLHTPGDSNAYLTGTPTVAGPGTYNLTATNSNGRTQTIGVPMTVAADTISFSGTPPDASYNFVISRPLASALPGYYPAPISYSATAASGANVTLSITNAPSGVTGISVGSNLTLGGIPDTITAPTTAVITAFAPFTGATATRNLNYSVLTDDISITSPTSTLTFFQNQTLTPVQFAATTLSERPVVSWTSPNLPAGLSLSTTGRLTGVPTLDISAGTFTVSASTGYVSEANSIPYQTIADDILITLVTDPTTVSQQFSNVEFNALSYSGLAANMSVGTIEPTQNPPITLDMCGNFLSGDLTTADGILSRYRFNINATAGSLVGSQAFLLDVDNPSTQRRLVLDLNLTSNVTPFPSGVFTLYQNEERSIALSGPSTSNLAPLSNWTVNFSNTDTVYGHIGDIARAGDVAVLVIGSNMYRSTDDGSTWQTISNIVTIPGIVGGYDNVPPVVTTPGPILVSVATDGNSNWLAIGVGYDSNASGAARTILRRSTNNGSTWFDTSLSPAIASLSPISRLYYNNGRYFLAQSNSTNPTLRADVSDLSVWTGASGGMPTFSGNIAYGFAFSNNTILCGGDDSGLTAVFAYQSTDNGDNWTVNNIGGQLGVGALVYSIAQSSGNWYVSTNSAGAWAVYSSSNLTTFIDAGTATTNETLNIDFDGTAFIGVGYDAPNTAVTTFPGLAGSGSNTAAFPPGMSVHFVKRMTTAFVDNGPTTARISLTGNTSPFILPTSNDFSLLQYVPVNIPVQIYPTGNFIHYYASNLPQGLRLALDTSGSAAAIVGTPSRYDPGGQRVRLYARDALTATVVNTPIDIRVILPFVVKKQAGASDYTALLRQYVTVNAAQASRDSVALPVQERNLGEFTAPDAPSVVTPSNCPC